MNDPKPPFIRPQVKPVRRLVSGDSLYCESPSVGRDRVTDILESKGLKLRAVEIRNAGHPTAQLGEVTHMLS
jgi:hypothetical protein